MERDPWPRTPHNLPLEGSPVVQARQVGPRK